MPRTEDGKEGDQLGGSVVAEAPVALMGWLRCGGCGLRWR
jgi:hypothetical protein